jgi:hypothetical protein
MLTLGVKDLVAHGRTRQEIAEYIGADEVIFQDLDGKDGLKAACMEAAESTSQVQDFEVGVFCGKYVTGVPKGYFEHLSELRSGKRREMTAVTTIKSGGDEEGSVAGSSGSTNLPPEADEADAFGGADGIKSSDHHDDIRYVVVDIEIALRYTNVLTVFTTSQANLRCVRSSHVFIPVGENVIIIFLFFRLLRSVTVSVQNSEGLALAFLLVTPSRSSRASSNHCGSP